MPSEILNRVSQSGLIELNLENYFPQGERTQYDLKNNLWQGLALKEKEFRDFVQHNDWSVYRDKNVAVHCSADAIVPTWAYMLVVSALQPFAKKIVFGSLETLETVLWTESLSKINPGDFRDAKIVVKGCSDKNQIPECAYVEITRILKPEAASIMYGEPCSTVPVFKKKKSASDA